MILDECTPENIICIYLMFFQFSFEIKGQNFFPDNHEGKIMFANKTGNFRGDSKGLFKCRPIAH